MLISANKLIRPLHSPFSAVSACDLNDLIVHVICRRFDTTVNPAGTVTVPGPRPGWYIVITTTGGFYHQWEQNFRTMVVQKRVDITPYLWSYGDGWVTSADAYPMTFFADGGSVDIPAWEWGYTIASGTRTDKTYSSDGTLINTRVRILGGAETRISRAAYTFALSSLELRQLKYPICFASSPLTPQLGDMGYYIWRRGKWDGEDEEPHSLIEVHVSGVGFVGAIGDIRGFLPPSYIGSTLPVSYELAGLDPVTDAAFIAVMGLS